jgi:hypothetical protein
VRMRSMISAAALLAIVAPAQAQMFLPGGPGVLSLPESASGAVGAGAGHSAEPQECVQTMNGRAGPHTQCAPDPERSEPRPKR